MSQSFIKQPDNGPHSALGGLGVLSTERPAADSLDLLRRILTKAAQDVLAERQRQVNAEGWTPEHDDEHVNGELAFAAACYASHASARAWVSSDFPDGGEHYKTDEPPNDWPDSWDPSWWKPKNRRRDLVRGAALLLAEIERRDRAEAAAANAGVDLPDGGQQYE